ncbi:hypothetical protein A9A71_11530 [Stutzerimonas stutzeri]|jgi:hypothetical protein|nr:hypothetical protein CP157_01723 [Paracoccus marcusii]TYP64543.1 hypothetical protein A9A71_11530 [Stutzerimonas stutzeri]|tara:strand:+ start:342 stop:461 length:120 start_codon:yes stop_codon:yes gene_type:complete
MFRLSLCAILALSACAAPKDPCADLCMSAFVEYEPGFEP